MSWYQTFPGSSGFYVSREDTNLLDSDSSHLHQAIGIWSEYDVQIPVTMTRELDDDGFGDYVGKVTFDDSLVANNVIVVLGNGGDFTILDTEEYVFSMDVRMSVGWASGNVRLANHGASAGIGPTVDATAGETGWQRATMTRTATGDHTPALRFLVDDPVSGDYFEFRNSCVLVGTSTEFTPSLRIVGDLDLRAKVAATDWTDVQTVIDLNNNNATNKGLTLYVTSDLLAVHFPIDGSANRTEASNLGGLTDGEAVDMRFTADVSAGTANWYLDNAVVDTDTFTVGALGVNTTQAATVGRADGGGNEFEGDLYWAEIRDGIDGPIVAGWYAYDAWVEAT